MFDFNHGAEALFLYGAFQHLEKEGEELDELEVDNEPRNMHPSTSFNDFDDDDFYDEYSDEDDDFDFDDDLDDDFDDEYDEYDDYDEDDYEDDDFDDDDGILDDF